jgi:ferritin-like metal-binding protein YciE
MARELEDQLTQYLADAHSLEMQALPQLRTAPDLAGDPEIAAAFREHLAETQQHERRTRELLEALGEHPNEIKYSVMNLSGKGFLLVAKLQPDTPGRLVAHALSYEALELASYELVARADDRDVVDAARGIRNDERRMQELLEASFDRSVEASLRELDRDDLLDQLSTYLADAHAIEEQSIQLIQRAPKLVDDAALGHLFEEHLVETREPSELVEERLAALDGSPSKLKDAALRLGALNWSELFHAQPGTPGKLAAFAYVFEHLEIGGYEQLKRVALRAGDEDTARVCDGILAQERQAAGSLADAFDWAATVSLRAVGVA